jgi:hypothetical protein
MDGPVRIMPDILARVPERICVPGRMSLAIRRPGRAAAHRVGHRRLRQSGPGAERADADSAADAQSHDGRRGPRTGHHRHAHRIAYSGQRGSGRDRAGGKSTGRGQPAHRRAPHRRAPGRRTQPHACTQYRYPGRNRDPRDGDDSPYRDRDRHSAACSDGYPSAADRHRSPRATHASASCVYSGRPGHRTARLTGRGMLAGRLLKVPGEQLDRGLDGRHELRGRCFPGMHRKLSL